MLTIIANTNETAFSLCMLVNGEFRLLRTYRTESEAFAAAHKLKG